MSDGSKHDVLKDASKVVFVSPDRVDREGLFGSLWGRLRTDPIDAMLVESIRRYGIYEPIQLIEPKGDDGLFHLVTGRGRLLAAREIGMETVPASVLDLGGKDAVIRGLMGHHPDRRYSAAQAAALACGARLSRKRSG